MKVSFIGSGGVACTTAFALSFKNFFNEMVMLDINPNIAKGKAIDLQQSFILNHKNINIIGTSDYKLIEGSDVIVITAGSAEAGADREALLQINKKIITEVANNLKKYIKNDNNQPFIVLLTNPLDSILKTFIDVGNFNKKKTIGSGNWLDTARFKYYLAKKLNINFSDIETFVIGQHGKKMVYLLSQTKIKNESLSDYLKKQNIDIKEIYNVCNQSTLGGAEIIDLIKFGGTYYGPANSIVELIDAYINNTKGLFSSSIYCNGEYDIHDCCLGLPVILGENGVQEIKTLNISNEEKMQLKSAYDFVKELNNIEIK